MHEKSTFSSQFLFVLLLNCKMFIEPYLLDSEFCCRGHIFTTLNKGVKDSKLYEVSQQLYCRIPIQGVPECAIPSFWKILTI